MGPAASSNPLLNCSPAVYRVVIQDIQQVERDYLSRTSKFLQTSVYEYRGEPNSKYVGDWANLAFSDLAAGTHRLELALDDRVIAVEDVTIGRPSQ